MLKCRSGKTSNPQKPEELNELAVENVICDAVRAHIDIYPVDVAYLASFSEGKRFSVKPNLCFTHM